MRAGSEVALPFLLLSFGNHHHKDQLRTPGL